MEIIEIKKSKFLPFIFDIQDKSDVKKIYAYLKKEYPKAAHYVSAYIYRNEKNVLCGGFDNDGEPCGGRHILNILEIKKIENKAIFVVRFFGGIKLGSGGLARAFTKAAALLFKN
ncbi:YigZ family protein [Metamycoplasma neophronis]|uniref:YigZ family protein n=1 Tax=Metamycoplasma neophronis TaxID=872983 RepID=A0ABY2Z0E8_9BACT|nr:YigZ family protein [Metamycoplasma neophronis]TPR53537.1 YigZ family protein [Metamycoplasma neophronis]